MEAAQKMAVLDRLERRFPDEGMRNLVRELRQRIERESELRGPDDGIAPHAAERSGS